MADSNQSPVRVALRSALAAAMAQRDRAAMAVYRTAIAAIENAEAIAVVDEHRAGALEAAAVGVGASEAPRRALSVSDEIEIVTGEIRDRLAAAGSLAVTRPEDASRLRNEAALLQGVLAGSALAGEPHAELRADLVEHPHEP